MFTMLGPANLSPQLVFHSTHHGCMTHACRELVLQAIVLFLVPLGDDMWNIGINPKRIEP